MELRVGMCMLAVMAAGATAPARAADSTSGTLVVAGKTVRLTHGLALAKKGFFDPKSDDVEVVLCDAVVPIGGTEAKFARMEMGDKGTAHCVENTINAAGNVLNFTLRHNAFKMTEGGASTDMVYEPGPKKAGRITGRVRTKAPGSSFEKIPYTYDVTFDLAVAPKQ